MTIPKENMWISLCKKYRNDFESSKDQVAWFNGFVTVAVAKYIHIVAYKYLVSNKKLIDISLLPDDQKKELKETAIEIANGKLNVPDLVDFCKCLYVFDYISNLKN